MDSREWEELRETAEKLEAIRARDPESFRRLKSLVETLLQTEACRKKGAGDAPGFREGS